jgi:hypothetical protein
VPIYIATGIDLEFIRTMPFRKLLKVHVEQSESNLAETACFLLSVVLGHGPPQLADSDFAKLTADYFVNFVVPYTSRVGLAVLCVWGTDALTPEVFDTFNTELMKASPALIPNPDVASVVLGDTRRLWHLFMAVVCATAVLCKRSPETAALFRLKKNFFGSWQLARDDG